MNVSSIARHVGVVSPVRMRCILAVLTVALVGCTQQPAELDFAPASPEVTQVSEIEEPEIRDEQGWFTVRCIVQVDGHTVGYSVGRNPRELTAAEKEASHNVRAIGAKGARATLCTAQGVAMEPGAYTPDMELITDTPTTAATRPQEAPKNPN